MSTTFYFPIGSEQMSKTIPTINDELTEKLQSMATRVNERYFGGMITSRVIWAVPRSSVGRAGAEAIPDTELPEGAGDILIKVADAADRGDVSTAIDLLTPMAEAGHDNSLKAMIILCQNAGLDEKAAHWASIRNEGANRITLPAPGSIEKEDGKWSLIKVHPSLAVKSNPKIPAWVIEYVIHHEMLHEFLDTTQSDPHPEIFLKHEHLFKKREKAVEWLKSKGFSTLGECV